MTVKIITILLVATAALRAGDWHDQFWPEANIYVKTSEHSRLFFLYAGTREKEEGYTDGQLGVHIDFYFAPLVKKRAERHPDVSRDKFLFVRAGYLFGKTPPNSTNPFTENTVDLEITSRYFLPMAILVSDRNRSDLRFKNGSFQPRYRNRLRMERTFQIGKRAITPYAHAEVFYDWQYNAWNRQRYTAGGELELSKRCVLEAYYLRQEDSKSSVRSTNVLGLAVQLYLR